MYNLVFLLLIWYKLRQSRKDKLELEFTFYQRVEGIMLRMTDIFNDKEFGSEKKAAEVLKEKIMKEALPFGSK
jgi:hypothetical protein